MSLRSVQVLVAFGVVVAGVFLVWHGTLNNREVFPAATGGACEQGWELHDLCVPFDPSLAGLGATLVQGALLALIYLRYLADRKPVH